MHPAITWKFTPHILDFPESESCIVLSRILLVIGYIISHVLPTLNTPIDSATELETTWNNHPRKHPILQSTWSDRFSLSLLRPDKVIELFVPEHSGLGDWRFWESSASIARDKALPITSSLPSLLVCRLAGASENRLRPLRETRPCRSRATYPPCSGADHFWQLRCRKSACRCGAKHVSKWKCTDHFWKFRCRKSERRCGAKHISKSKCTKHTMYGPFLEVQKSFRVAGARDCGPCQNWEKTWGFCSIFNHNYHYTTLHSNTLHYTTTTTTTTLHYILLRYTPLHCTALNYTQLHYTTLHYTTLHSTTLHYTTLHYTTLRYTTFHYTTLHYATLHYTTLHYITLHSTTLHLTCTYSYTPLH